MKKIVLNATLLLVLLSCAFYLRFFKIESFATFGHDNSRDLILLYKLYYYKEYIYRGPVFSIFWAHLSFIYYYLLLPAAILNDFRPISIPLFTSLLSLVTTVILYFTTLKLYNIKVAFTCSLLYSISFLVIKEAAFGLNPCFMPVFAVLLYYSIVKTIEKSSNALYLLGLSFAGLISFHPSGFIAVVVGLIIIWYFRPKLALTDLYKVITPFTLFAVLPYAIQERKFNYFDLKQVVKYFTVNNSIQSEAYLHYLKNFFVVLVKNLSTAFFGRSDLLYIILSSAFLFVVVIYAIRIIYKQTRFRILCLMFTLYLVPVSLIIKFEDTGLRSGWFSTYLIPYAIIILGVILVKIYESRFYIFALIALLVICFFNINAIKNYKYQNDSYIFVKNVAELIRLDANGRNFKIIGINPEAYVYYLWYTETNPSKKNEYFGYLKWNKEYPFESLYFIEQKERFTSDVKDRIVNEFKNNLSTNRNIITEQILSDKVGNVYAIK